MIATKIATGSFVPFTDSSKLEKWEGAGMEPPLIFSTLA
jgi:hypothetical protein